VSEVPQVVDEHGAPGAPGVGPVLDARLEEGPVDDQLRPAVEQVGQRPFAVGAEEPIGLRDLDPRQPAPLGRELIASAGRRLLLREQRVACRLPLLG
jgi:hypothetical protein